MTYLIKRVVVIVVTSIWAIVGFYIWIPAVIVASVAYAVGLVVAALIDDTRIKEKAEDLLDRCVQIYSEGFQRIKRVAVKDPSSNLNPYTVDSKHFASDIFFKAVAVSLAILFIATIIWTILYMIMGYAFKYVSKFADHPFV